MQLIINKYAKNIVEKNQKTLMITCDVHGDSLVEYYIKSLNRMICQTCLVTTYKAHLGEAILIEGDRLDTYVQAALAKMHTLSDHVNKIMDKYTQLSLNELAMPASDFMVLVRDVESFFQEEKKEDEILLSFMTNPQDNPTPKMNPVNPKMEISEWSQIDEVNDNLDLIYQWTGAKRLDLCYTATQHGFNVDSLHEHIKGKGPSITFIKSEYG